MDTSGRGGQPDGDTIGVLHVDADPEFGSVTARSLEREQSRFAVRTATEPDEALEHVREVGCDCVVSEYDLPGTDGIDLLERVRSVEPDLPFMLFTGVGDEDVARSAIDAGVTDYLQKGAAAQYAVLANRISDAVSRYAAERRARQRERELERRNDLFAKAQDLASGGGWEYDCRTGEAYWTDEVARIYGLSPDYDHTLEEAFEFYHPEDRPAIRDAFERARAEGDPYDLTLRLRTADGDERWVRTRGDPEFEDGDCVSIRGTIQDVTERREREQELRRYGTIVEALDDAVYAVDQDGRIEYVNERYVEMKGVDKAAVLGTSIRQWVGDDTLGRIDELIDDLERGERDVCTLEYEFATTDGRRFPVEVRFTDLEFPDGQQGRVGVIRDVTERRERERELERKNDRLEEFTSVVSHDLRNPLDVLSMSLDLIETDEEDHLDRCRQSVDRMEQLIDDLLTLARQGESISDPTAVSLRAVATDCWRTVESTGVDLTVETDITVGADEARLRQLLGNLFRNTVEHGSTSPRSSSTREDAVEEITVGALEDGFYVADDGVGIPPGDRDRVTDSADGGARFEFTGVDTAR